jgi:NhaP-type Na+/H+ or K+/H+ antiporter
MGVVCGVVFVRMFSFAAYEPLVEIILSFAAAYGTFYMAQHVCGVSGVVAIVVCGLYISLNYEACIAPESQDLMHKVWDVAVLMANTVIFALIGVMVAEIAWQEADIRLADIARCVATYLVVNVARALVVLLSYPLLRSSVGWRGCVLVSWGGLRGAVSLVLAFMVFKNDAIPESISRPFLSQTANVVVSTLIINGWFTKNLVHYLRLDQVSDAKLIRHRAAVRIVKEALEQSLGKLHEDELLGHANWNVVSRYAVGVLDQDLALANVSTTDFNEMARVTFLDAIQSSISAQYKLGLLSVFGVSTLTNRLHECLENPDQPLRLSLSKEMFDIPVWQTMMAQTPVFGVFFRQAITESWAAYYNMAIAYILAINSAIRVCEQRDLVRANSAWDFFREASAHDLEPPHPGPTEGYCSSPTAYHPAQKYRTQCLFSTELTEIMAQYGKLRDEVQKELQQLKRRNPSLARAVETQHAIRSVLNHGLYTVDELHEEGVIDRSTQETLLHNLQQRITSASPGAFLPVASPLIFGLMSTDEEALPPERAPLL